jgi:hypothetical protein
VLDANRAKWVGSFVRCSTGGAFQGRMVAGFSGEARGDQTWVVFGAVLLCADGADGFFLFAEFGVVSITLAVTAVGSWSPRKIFGNTAFAVTEGKCGCAKALQIEGTLEGDNDGGGSFVEPAFSWDKPARFLHEL